LNAKQQGILYAQICDRHGKYFQNLFFQTFKQGGLFNSKSAEDVRKNSVDEDKYSSLFGLDDLPIGEGCSDVSLFEDFGLVIYFDIGH